MIENHKIKKAISHNIKEFRRQRGIKQRELARKLNVAPSTVSSWEQSISVPDIDTLFKLCQIFKVSIEEICSISQDVGHNTRDEHTKAVQERIAFSEALERVFHKDKLTNIHSANNTQTDSSVVAESETVYNVQKKSDETNIAHDSLISDAGIQKLNYILDLSTVEKKIILSYRKGDSLDKQLIERACGISAKTLK